MARPPGAESLRPDGGPPARPSHECRCKPVPLVWLGSATRMLRFLVRTKQRTIHRSQKKSRQSLAEEPAGLQHIIWHDWKRQHLFFQNPSFTKKQIRNYNKVCYSSRNKNKQLFGEEVEDPAEQLALAPGRRPRTATLPRALSSVLAVAQNSLRRPPLAVLQFVRRQRVPEPVVFLRAFATRSNRFCSVSSKNHAGVGTKNCTLNSQVMPSPRRNLTPSRPSWTGIIESAPPWIHRTGVCSSDHTQCQTLNHTQILRTRWGAHLQLWSYNTELVEEVQCY